MREYTESIEITELLGTFVLVQFGSFIKCYPLRVLCGGLEQENKTFSDYSVQNYKAFLLGYSESIA